jgi:hypothetical protein
MLRFVDCVLPCAAEPFDFSAMHQAGAAKTDQLGLFRAPSPQSGSPFACATQSMDLLTRFDHAAVDQAGKQRRQFAGRDRNHRLIEKRETFCGPPLT